MRFLFFLLLGWIPSMAMAQVECAFRLPEALSEVSGLAVLGRDSFLWHNDSGNEPALFLTDAQGKLLRKEVFPQLPNTDWEDLAMAPDGRLFVGNFGNNCNCRKDLSIYILSEAEGAAVDSIAFRLADQNSFPPGPEAFNFDLEAMIWHRDSLHLFSKSRGEKGNDFTKHYVLPAQPGQHVAELRDRLRLKRRFISAAAISPDAQQVALLGLRYKQWLGFIPITRGTVFLFSGFSDSRFLRGEVRKKCIRPFFYALQYEALDFYDSNTLVVGSEKTLFIPAKAKRLKLGKRFFAH